MRKYEKARYIVHPVRVMELLSGYTSDRAMLAAALLHDVLEDTPATRHEIRDFLLTIMDKATADRTTELVVELTDIYVKEDFPSMNRKERKKKEAERMETVTPQAQTIKYADIIDNAIDITRHDTGFAPRFLKECRHLLERMPKGDPQLYRRAVDTVEEGLRKLKMKN